MRLIDADKLKEKIIASINLNDVGRGDWWKGYADGLELCAEYIDNAPTVPLPDFKEGYKQAIIDGKTNFSRPRGEWIDIYKNLAYECSNCHKQMIVTDFNYCPNCGAKMGGKETDFSELRRRFEG